MQSNIFENLNPYNAKISENSRNIEMAESKKEKLVEDLKRFEKLDTSDHASKLDKLTIELADLNKKKNSNKSAISSLILRDAFSEASAGFKYNPLRLIIKNRREAAKQSKEAKEKIGFLRKEIDTIEHQITTIYIKKSNLIDEVEFKKEFNLDQSKINLNMVQSQLDKLIIDRAVLFIKFDKIEAVLKTIKDHIKTTQIEINKTQADLATAYDLLEQLENAAHGGERKAIHQACDDVFGYSSPNKVISNLKMKIQGLERSLKKYIERAKQTVIKAERTISTVVIDGNNLCHQRQSKNNKDGKFIGLKALSPLVRKLKQQYTVQVVFDNTITRSLGLDQIRTSLNIRDVHIVNGAADEFILDLAKDQDTYVISNDRYVEYFDKLAIKEKRVLNYEMFNNNLKIYDIDIDIDF